MALLGTSDYFVLLEIFIFLAIAQILHSLTGKIGLPEIVADLLAGMIIGGYALGGFLDRLVGIPLFVTNAGVVLFADFAVVLLLFGAGLDVGLSSLRKAGAPAVAAAIAGDLLPFGLTFLVFSRIYPANAALLIGVAAAATSTAVAASLLQGARLSDTPGGRFLINVAALDDVVALILLSVVLALLGGNANVLQISETVGFSVAAWVVLLLTAVVILPRLLKGPVLREVETLPFTLLFVVIAVVLAFGFSPVIGSFIAGLAVAESVVATRTRQMTAVLVAVIGPLFFIVIGAEFDVAQLASVPLIAGAVALSLIAALGKFVGVYPFARARLESSAAGRAVAVGVIPRGEIGLIVGAVGFEAGILNQQMLGAILLMAILTTLVGGSLFRRLAAASLQPATTTATSPP